MFKQKPSDRAEDGGRFLHSPSTSQSDFADLTLKAGAVAKAV